MAFLRGFQERGPRSQPRTTQDGEERNQENRKTNRLNSRSSLVSRARCASRAGAALGNVGVVRLIGHFLCCEGRGCQVRVVFLLLLSFLERRRCSVEGRGGGGVGVCVVEIEGVVVMVRRGEVSEGGM